MRLKTKLSLACVAAMGIAATASAEEATGVAAVLGYAEVSGSFISGLNNGGDAQFSMQLNPVYNDGEKPISYLVMLPGCQQDKPEAGDVVANLDEIIKNPDAQAKLYRPKAKDPRWQVCTEQNNILLEDSQEIKLSVDFIRGVDEGMAVRLEGEAYAVPEELLKQTSDPDELAKLIQEMNIGKAANFAMENYYRLDSRKQTWASGSWEDIFGKASEDEPALTSDYAQVLSSMPVFLQDYRELRLLPGEKELPDIREQYEQVIKQGSGVGRDVRLKSSQPKVLQQNLISGVDQLAAVSHTLSGVFSTRWTADHALHPGFGFRVEAWTNETGSWQKLASDWVQSNGTWQLQVDSSKGYAGNHLRILYRSYNQYYKPQNQDGDTYTWHDPDQYGIDASFYAGHRYADTDGGTYNGVGELVDAAMWYWSRLYWVAGIDPVRSEPINFYYPNTWNNCSQSSPWSCANRNGTNIWLIPQHGTDAFVVAHEMSHALQSKFWDGKWPSGSGGSHGLNGCYDDRLGLTLSEGFANFMPGWVGYQSRNIAAGGFNNDRWDLWIDPEQNGSSPSCSKGWENETWVARTFWDLHDTHWESGDVLWFNHMGAVINLYLNNGVANDGDAMDMRNFENIYRNAASSGHQGYISDIFNLNKM